MSARFIAHVERPDGRVHHIDCDAAHENDAGRLSLTVNTYIGAIAAYAPGEWLSYYLEAAPEPVTQEQVERGEKSINDYRRHHGMRPFPEDEPETLPQVGDRVHVWLSGHGCRPGVVDARVTDQPTGGDTVAVSIKLDDRTDDCSHRITAIHDEARQIPGSWHWPHDDERSVEQAPDAPAPITINVHVAGSVLAEKQLENLIASQLGRIAAQRGLRF